jgi:hypothetical protein
MKITRLSIFSFAAGLTLLTACKKEDTTPTTVAPVTIEESKSNLQQAGLDAMKEMEDAKNLSSIENSIYFTDLLNQSNPFDQGSASGIMPIRVLYALNAFKKSGDQSHIYSALRKAKSLEDDSTITMLFEDIKGEYSWDATNKKWNKTSNDDLILNFPSNETKTTNNAQYRVSYKGYTGNVIDPKLEGNMPTMIEAKLSVDGDVLIKFNFDAAYNSDGVPNSLEANLNVKPFNFNTKLTANSTDVAYSYAFTHNTKNILSFGAALKGDFTKAHLETLNDNSIEKVEDLTKIATSVSSYIQVLEVKLEGTGNISGMVKEVEAKGGSESMKQEDAVVVLNNNLKLRVFRTSDNVTLAHTEFYMDKVQHTTSVWNETTQQYEDVTSMEDEMKIRMIFDDGSKADLETYFGKGFEKLEDEMTSFLKAMEEKYGSKG